MADEAQPLAGPDVEAIRSGFGLDQAAFGQLIGVSERTVRGWESGAVIPSSTQFTLRLVRHCGLVRPQVASGQIAAILCSKAVTHLSCAIPGDGAEWTPIGNSPMLIRWACDLNALLGRGE